MNSEEVMMASRKQASYLARFVRDAIEDIHAKGLPLTDDIMPEFNRLVRSAIYTGLRSFELLATDREAALKIFFTKQPPEYWEDVYEESEKKFEELVQYLGNI